MPPPSKPPPLRSRRRVLSEWRRVDLTDAETARAVQGRPVREILTGVMQGIGLEKKRAESHIMTIWKQAIDPAVTAHAEPDGLVKGTLFVNVDSNVWLHEINRYRRREILERLQHVLGRETIRKISFRLG